MTFDLIYSSGCRMKYSHAVVPVRVRGTLNPIDILSSLLEQRRIETHLQVTCVRLRELYFAIGQLVLGRTRPHVPISTMSEGGGGGFRAWSEQRFPRGLNLECLAGP